MIKPLPEPGDLMSLVLRTDFSDDAAWDAVRAAIDGHAGEYPDADYVDDPAYAGVTVEALVEADAAAPERAKVTYLFLADATTMADPEHALLAVDLYIEPGRTMRVLPSCFSDVSVNVSLGNMDFAEFADNADEAGTFRGFD
ncbi:MAG: DUF6924 domain-containing protein [Mycobacteriales bacterium]|jgi:hypothetical protein